MVEKSYGKQSLDSGSRPGAPGSAMPFGKLEKSGLALVPPFDTIGTGANKKEKAKKQTQEDIDDWEGHRREREWSGEWNIKNMDVVANKLRNLR